MIRKIHNIATSELLPSIAVLLTIVLFLFSQIGIVTWPWWVIVSPLLGLAALYLIILFVWLFAMLIIAIIYGIIRRLTKAWPH